jgi:hypothetical protein
MQSPFFAFLSSRLIYNVLIETINLFKFLKDRRKSIRH